MRDEPRIQNIHRAVSEKSGPEQEVIDAGRDDFAHFLFARGLKTGVEIGVAKGEYGKVLCDAGLTVFGVDPYRAYPGYEGDGFQERLDAEYDEARDRLADLPYTFVRKTSVEAAQGFEDGSLDFVYIDGHHGFKFVAEDLHTWVPKVKEGGVISGHDFVFATSSNKAYRCDTKHVIRAWTHCYRIKDWYVIGRYHFPKDPNEKRDRWRSWFWFNKW